MKKWLITIAMLIAFTSLGMAQVTKTFAWDASASVSTPENPIKYRFYVCASQAYTGCQMLEAGTALEIPYTLQNGTVFVYVTAYWYSLVVDGIPQGDIAESGKSNVLKIQVQIPPGNPGNAKIKVTSVEPSASGQELKI